ncbi:piggyBac transposable element-derived protein 4-like [Macrobrachium nipponense]|uniref:piggyBac transposable element-derived protein 4-like n=1 Tax=Macrobrachium nipponense TaxID=159736 RepID=UPI0030C85F0B
MINSNGAGLPKAEIHLRRCDDPHPPTILEDGMKDYLSMMTRSGNGGSPPSSPDPNSNSSISSENSESDTTPEMLDNIPVMANYHDNSDTEESFTELESSGSEGDDSSLDDSSDDDSDTNTDTDTVMDETQWRRIADSTAPPPPRFPFTGTTGLNIPGNIESMSPLDFFHVFFDDELIELICTETNRFAEQCNADPNTWHPVTSPKLRVFLALNTLKGIVKKPEESLYWSKNPLLRTPIFAESMPFKRYKKIRQYLHFSDNEAYDANSHPNPKLNKIYPIYVHLENKFRNCLHPTKKIFQ